MEDQKVYGNSTQEIESGESSLKKLYKKEQRLLERLQDEQEAEAEAQSHFQRAEARLQRRRKRVEKFQRKLSLVREKLAALQTTDQHTVYEEHESVEIPTPESTTRVDTGEVIPLQSEQFNGIVQEPDVLSQTFSEYLAPEASEQEQELSSTHVDESDVPAVDSVAEIANEQETPLTQPETASPAPTSDVRIEAEVEPEAGTIAGETSNAETGSQQEEPTMSEFDPPSAIETTPEPAIPASYAETDGSSTPSPEIEASQVLEDNPIASIESTTINEEEQEPAMASGPNEFEEAEEMESAGTAPEINAERRPTKPLQLEQPDSSSTASPDVSVQPAKEAWIAAESTMQQVRNTANSINASIALLSQTDGLSKEFMEELERKQAEANSELLKAQQAARSAYEHFVQVQKEAQSAASQPTHTFESSSQQNQEGASLPSAQENGLDQTAEMHAVSLYTEW